ncbi:MAG TPA: ECF transporter S component [Microthrixaceae bacterium]|nr:ECF transporter S component [Microthrixaceae bacterium]
MLNRNAAPSTSPTDPSARPTPTPPTGSGRALAVGRRPSLVLAVASVGGLVMFLWPLLVSPPDEVGHVTDAPFVFALILPVVIAVVLSELHSGGIDTKALAMLGVLTAIGAALRPMGAGVAGLETVFFLLVLAGRVYGAGFGFVLGTTTMFTSAILTGGIGPWLPFQMMASGWVGLGAGLLPDSIAGRALRGRTEIAVLALYGAVAAYAYGFLMNMWFWPFAIGAGTELSFVAGAPVVENLHRFVLFTLATSTLGWDTGRAITNVVAVVLLGPIVLTTLRRSVRRAAFDAPVAFGATPAGPTPPNL